METGRYIDMRSIHLCNGEMKQSQHFKKLGTCYLLGYCHRFDSTIKCWYRWPTSSAMSSMIACTAKVALIARFMRPIWGPSGADRTQVGPMLVPWTLLSGTRVKTTCVMKSLPMSICTVNCLCTLNSIVFNTSTRTPGFLKHIGLIARRNTSRAWYMYARSSLSWFYWKIWYFVSFSHELGIRCPIE